MTAFWHITQASTRSPDIPLGMALLYGRSSCWLQEYLIGCLDAGERVSFVGCSGDCVHESSTHTSFLQFMHSSNGGACSMANPMRAPPDQSSLQQGL